MKGGSSAPRWIQYRASGGSGAVWWTVRKVAQQEQQGASGGIIIRGQRREGQGRPDDANGRYGSSSEIKKTKV
jgi:hypothetical protein